MGLILVTDKTIEERRLKLEAAETVRDWLDQVNETMDQSPVAKDNALRSLGGHIDLLFRMTKKKALVPAYNPKYA